MSAIIQISKSGLMKSVLLISLLVAVPLILEAQTIVLLERYVCPNESSSQFIYSAIKAPESDRVCSSGTQMKVITSGDVSIASSITVTREGGGQDGPHRAIVDISWNDGMTGIVSIDVYYRRMEHKITDCDWEGWKYMYTYKVYREGANPSGEISGNDTATATDEEAISVFDLSYRPSTSYPSSLTATKIRYRNGRDEDNNGEQDLIVTDIVKLLSIYTPTPILFYAKGFGTFQLETEILDDCGTWYQGPTKTLTVNPSCFSDDLSNISITISGPSLVAHPEGYEVQMNQSYTLDVSGVTDFGNHYVWNVDDGAQDISFDGSSFTLLKGLGSYRIDAVNKSGRELCPTLPSVKIFVGGSDVTLEQVCPIILPEDFADFGYSVDPDDIILQHFAATVISKRSIVVKPGVTLTLGAELILDRPAPQPEPNDSDISLNFIEQTSYDEYGRLISAGRNYFDTRGLAIQSQYKNLTAGVILANETLYDAQGRPVVSTLSAPVHASTETTEVDECGGNQTVGDKVRFAYKGGFVKATDGTDYKYKNFDLLKEESPDGVAGNEEGTLGWYYSLNNGNSSNSRMNEPLVAETQFPYSRTLFYHDGSGEVKGSTKPGNAFRAGAGHTAFSNAEAVTEIDSYLQSYLLTRENELGFVKPAVIDQEFYRTVVQDESGKKSLVYQDKSGNAIISIYLGLGTSPITKSYQFYDNAGRLKASISPNGVQEYNGSNFGLIDKTTYEYNHKGWLTALNEPDAGRSEYVYRKDGKIRFSQNEEQHTNGRYSYTNYDRSGRPVESGEYTPASITFKSDAMRAILENVQSGGGLPTGEGTYAERIFTYYDLPSTILAENMPELSLPVQRTQRFVHGAVSASKNDNVITWYSYDERGRVEWMVQQIKDLGTKILDYRYGPTGAVQEIVFQKGVDEEQFTHFYEYDPDGRLFKVYTTRNALDYTKTGELVNSSVLELQATYQYYLHGPLKRVVYANGLQGIDYVYTADGALKGINDADPANDPGKDGAEGSDVRTDVFGMTLDYYSGDYLSNGHVTSTSSYPSGTNDQLTGLIKGNRWHSPIGGNVQEGYAYRYDERNQLQDARWIKAIPNTTNPYLESIGDYDANGNIKNLQRKGDLGNALANFSYDYTDHTNKLKAIRNSDNSLFRNYTYNKLGQTTEQTDATDKQLKMTYDVSGKVTTVRNENDALVTNFTYDDRGFRLSKTSYNESGNADVKTWYVRDASGNVISTYDDKLTDTEPAKPIEVPVYASGKIGLYKPQFDITFYELTDHLGNVRAVIGDKVTAEYMATMEVERTEKENDFLDVNPVVTADYINHTPTSVTVDGQTDVIDSPNKVIRINNALDNPKKPIGGGILLWVHPGDIISAEVFAKYANFDGSNSASVVGLASYLAGTFGSAAIAVDGANIFSPVDQTPSGVFSALDNIDNNLPKAFLNYVLYDKNMVPLGFDQDQVSVDAQIPASGTPAEIASHAHERLSHEVIIEKEGFIYVYVSNQSDQNMDVYFDDLKVTHKYSDIVAGGDFYPFGLAIEDRLITRENYRFGYQGQFAEKDEETGWNHFELREYDPIIGRWTTLDPKMQYHSPYLSMGNNPVNRTDPDGGFDEYNMINGEKVWVSNKGGSNVEYVNYYENIDGVSTYTSTAALALTDAGQQILGGVPLMWSYEGIVISLDRTTFTTNSTIGAFTTSSGDIEGFIMEPAWDESLATTAGSDRAIEPGAYYLTRHISAKYTADKHAYRLLDVHGRVAILIHSGNYPEDTTGCLLPGGSSGVDNVTGSTAKREELHNLIQGNNFGAKIIINDKVNVSKPRGGY